MKLGGAGAVITGQGEGWRHAQGGGDRGGSGRAGPLSSGGLEMCCDSWGRVSRNVVVWLRLYKSIL